MKLHAHDLWLFRLKGDGRMVGSIRKFDSKDEEDSEDWICELIDFVFGKFKLCLPLKVCMAPLFSFLFLLIVALDERSRRYDHGNVLCSRKLRFCSSWPLPVLSYGNAAHGWG